LSEGAEVKWKNTKSADKKTIASLKMAEQAFPSTNEKLIIAIEIANVYKCIHESLITNVDTWNFNQISFVTWVICQPLRNTTIL
jgi:hypothetical protein